jgi:MFS family permease
MSDLAKIKLSDILASSQFWMVTFIIYMQAQGLTVAQALQTISFYSICTVIFEYPTGVIADYFSPKLSLISGYFLLALAFVLVSFHGSFTYYLFVFLLGALGTSLTSGSDIALLHSASNNFKEDYSQVKYYSLIMSVTAITIGGFIAPYNLKLPLYLTSFFFLISGLLLLPVKKYAQERIAGNIFATAKEGVYYTFKNSGLLYLIIINSILGTFFISYKWFYNPLLEAIHIPLTIWGIIISIATLAIAAGTWIYKRGPYLSRNMLMVFLIGSVLMMGVTPFSWIVLMGIMLTALLRGHLETRLDVEINSHITSSARASILSLNSFLIRIGSTLYISLVAYLLPRTSFITVFFITAGVFGLVTIYELVSWIKKYV